jgi:hypothetical protein
VSTITDDRDAIVALLTGRGWVPVAEVAALLRSQLVLSRRQGQGDLRALVDAGRLQRRPGRARNRWGGVSWAWEYAAGPWEGGGCHNCGSDVLITTDHDQSPQEERWWANEGDQGTCIECGAVHDVSVCSDNESAWLTWVSDGDLPAGTTWTQEGCRFTILADPDERGNQRARVQVVGQPGPWETTLASWVLAKWHDEAVADA